MYYLGVGSGQKMGKTDLVKGEKLFAGLNPLEPRLEHALHAHEGQEKMYFVLEGAGEVQVGETTETLGVGDMAFAPLSRRIVSLKVCFLCWLPDVDSNHGSRLQRPLSYR